LQLEDFSKLEINPEKVSQFAAMMESTKSLIERFKLKLQNRKVAAASAAAAPAAAAPAPVLSQPEQQLVAPVIDDPTEKLLQILQPNNTKAGAMVFPSAVAACLRKHFEEQQETFPLPKLNKILKNK
jgi:hypothetical protein